MQEWNCTGREQGRIPDTAVDFKKYHLSSARPSNSGKDRNAWLVHSLVNILCLTALTLTLSHPMGEGTAIG